MSADREFVQPMNIGMTVEGCRLEITPIVTGEVFELLELVEPFLEDLSRLDLAVLDVPEPAPDDADAHGVWKARKALLLEDLARLIVKSRGGLVAAIALCSRWHFAQADQSRVEGGAHRAWLEGLLLDRTVAIAVACIEVNRDFFSRALPQMEASVRGLAKQRGPAPGPPRSAGATPLSP